MIRLWCLLLVIGVGCGFSSHRTRNFPAVGQVTTITVKWRDTSNLSPKITDSARISQIVAFVDSRREGWYVPWYGIPVPGVSDLWLVSFMDYDLGYFDLETRALEPLENPFGPKVLPM
jgi:hypothetical protein